MTSSYPAGATTVDAVEVVVVGEWTALLMLSCTYWPVVTAGSGLSTSTRRGQPCPSPFSLVPPRDGGDTSMAVAVDERREESRYPAQ